MRGRSISVLAGIFTWGGMTSLVLLILLIALSICAIGEITINEPLHINEEVIWEGETIITSREIRIEEGGTLVVRNATLIFNCGYPLEAGITVEPGGRLLVGGDGSTSAFNRAVGTDSYFIRSHLSSIVTLTDLTMEGVSTMTGTVSPWNSGNSIRSDGARISNCTFQNSYIGLCLEGSSGAQVEDCRFLNCGQGLWVRQSANVVVRRCVFANCSKGLEYRNEDGGSERSMDVFQCTFINCTYGLTMNAYTQHIDECSFLGNRVGFRGTGARFIRLTSSKFDQGTTGIDLSYVENAQIRNVSIDTCVVGIGLGESSHGSVSDTTIRRCDVAVKASEGRWAMGSSIRVIDSIILDCQTGLYGTAIYPHSLPVGSIEIVGTRILNVSDPVFADGVLALMSWNCSYEGKRLNITIVNSTIASFENDAFDVGFVDLASTDVDELLIMDVDFMDAILSINLTNVSTGLLDVTAQPLSTMAALDKGSLLRGTMPPRDLDLHISDESSSYRWVKWLKISLKTMSSEVPVDGCEVEVCDAIGDLVYLSMTDSSGNVDVGEVDITIVSASGMLELWPHDIEMRWNGTIHMVPLDLSSTTNVHVERVFYLDDLPPILVLHSPQYGAIFTSGNVSIVGAARDDQSEGCSVRGILDGVIVMEVFSEWNLTIDIEPGWHLLLVEAMDVPGNLAVVHTWFLVLSGPPSIMVITPINGSFTSDAIITVSGTATGCTWLTVDSIWTAIAPNGSFSTYITLNEGFNGIQLEYGMDELTEHLAIEVSRDSIPPSIVIEDVPEMVNVRWMMVQGEVLDENPVSIISINKEEVALLDGSQFSFELILDEGENEISFHCEDIAGNTCDLTITVLVDTISFLEITSDIPAKTVQAEVLVGLVAELDSLVIVAVDNTSVAELSSQGGEVFFQVPLGGIGEHVISILAEDRAGNIAEQRFAVKRIGESEERYHIGFTLVIIIMVVAILLITILLIRQTRG